MTMVMHSSMSWVREICGEIFDLVAPTMCGSCGAEIPVKPPLCTLCRHHLVPAVDPPENVYVAYEHGGPLARAIYRAKYDGNPTLAVSLGQLLVENMPSFPEKIDAIVPAPLHPKRLRERGYNQSVELSRLLSKALGAEILFSAAQRTRNTPSQTRLDREARRRNVADAFAVSSNVCDRAVLIVDDVVTTGATLNALQQACLDAGARTVRTMTLSRATLHNAAITTSLER
jgi:ComF family protein